MPKSGEACAVGVHLENRSIGELAASPGRAVERAAGHGQAGLKIGPVTVGVRSQGGIEHRFAEVLEDRIAGAVDIHFKHRATSRISAKSSRSVECVAGQNWSGLRPRA